MSTLKTIFIGSVYGEGAAVGFQLQRENVRVVLTLLEDLDDTRIEGEKPKQEKPEDKRKRLSIYDGMVEKVSNQKFVEMIRKADHKTSFVYFDFNLLWKLSEQVKDLGIPGIYPIKEDRKMEADREAAKEFIKKNYKGVKVAEEHEFSKVEEGKKFLESSTEAFVLKGNDENAPTFVPDTDDPEVAKESVIHKLDEDKKLYEKGGFILEKKIPNPVELTPQMWFVDGKPVGAVMGIELKRFGAGEIGFLTGCSADCAFEIYQDSPIVKMAFPKAVMDMAKKRKGVFIWDLALLFDRKTGDAYASEFCPNRPGYNCFYSELAHFDEKKKFFENLMDGKNPYEGKDERIAASVRIFNFKPSGGQMKVAEEKKLSMDEYTENDAWPINVKEKDGQMMTTGDDYQMLVITGAGKTLQQAAKRAYEYVDGVVFEDKVYRPITDFLSDKYPTSIPNRLKWGKEKGIFYPV